MSELSYTCWQFPACPTREPNEIQEWALCRENVEKNGDYTPEEDGVEAYTVKMAARFHGHWILRNNALAKTQEQTERTEHLEAFAATQIQHAKDIIRTYPPQIQALICKQVQLYLKKDREYGPRME